MVDPESSYQYGIRGDYVKRRLRPEELADDDHLICTPVILGFCFNTKAWGTSQCFGTHFSARDDLIGSQYRPLRNR